MIKSRLGNIRTAILISSAEKPILRNRSASFHSMRKSNAGAFFDASESLRYYE